MSIKEKIQHELKTALKAKQTEKISTWRLLNAAIKNEEINRQKRDQGLSDDEIIAVIQKQIKQRRDSIAQFEKGGREDLVAREQQELQILQTLAPEQMSEEDIRQIVKRIRATGLANFGAVMGQVMRQIKGKSPGEVVRRIVEEELK